MEILLELNRLILCERLKEMITERLPESLVVDEHIGPVSSQPDVVFSDDRKAAEELTSNIPGQNLSSSTEA